MKSAWNKGSEWHRWDPHIHTPSTLFNNRFKSDWNGFLDAIENVPPVVEALGITDYCVLDGYKDFRKRWGAQLSSGLTLPGLAPQGMDAVRLASAIGSSPR